MKAEAATEAPNRMTFVAAPAASNIANEMPPRKKRL